MRGVARKVAEPIVEGRQGTARWLCGAGGVCVLCGARPGWTEAVPASGGKVLVGALPVEALSLAESNLLPEGQMQGAMLSLIHN